MIRQNFASPCHFGELGLWLPDGAWPEAVALPIPLDDRVNVIHYPLFYDNKRLAFRRLGTEVSDLSDDLRWLIPLGASSPLRT